MGWGSIIFIILVGLLLLVLDFLVIPGGIVAIIGILGMVGGVVVSFIQYGTLAGLLCTLFTAIVSIGSFILMLRSKTWKKLQLNTQIDSKMNEINEEKVKAGMIGRAISRIAPMGTGEFDGEIVEVSSTQNFIEENTEIEIVKIDNNKIYVKPKL